MQPIRDLFNRAGLALGYFVLIELTIALMGGWDLWIFQFRVVQCIR
jgi:hypothetical protein